jgi:hypothetical protein
MRTLLLLLAVATAALVGCEAKVNIKSTPEVPPPAPVLAASAPEQTSPTVEQALDTVARAHPRSKKICYETKHDAYFIYYVEPPKEEGDLNGWYYIDKIGFYPSSNGTYFIQEQAIDKYIKTYPDVTNLPCKERL